MASITGSLRRVPGWAAVLIVGLIGGMMLVEPGAAATPDEIRAPVTPVVEQNLDRAGYIAVHEQGTVSVESVQAPLREPFNAREICTALGGWDGNAVACDTYGLVTAPTDRWLVITQVSVWSSFFDQGGAVQVLLKSSYLDDQNVVKTMYRGFQPQYSGIPSPQLSSVTGYYHGSWNTEIYVPPGRNVDVNVFWAPSVITGSTSKMWFISVEGYMVQTPSS